MTMASTHIESFLCSFISVSSGLPLQDSQTTVARAGKNTRRHARSKRHNTPGALHTTPSSENFPKLYNHAASQEETSTSPINIFDFNHIDPSLSGDTVEMLKQLYAFYHNKHWGYEKLFRTFQRKKFALQCGCWKGGADWGCCKRYFS